MAEPGRSLDGSITRDRAMRIAKSHACPHCLEYSFKKLTVRAAKGSVKTDLKVAWEVTRICGVCGLEQELGLDAAGEVIFVG